MNDEPHHGLLVIDKPAGLTSHDVVARLRRITGIRRIGHTGTLDPLATGVLVICVGKATRLIPFLEEGGVDAKEYEATVCFGFETVTDDAEGAMRGERFDLSGLGAAEIEKALAEATGTIQQTPPEYSAKKVEGERAYDRARRGEAVAIAPASVTVATAVLLEWADPVARIRYECSRGTYIRSLARDLGRGLGYGAHLAGLRRHRSTGASIQDAVPLDLITRTSWLEKLTPIEKMLVDWLAIRLDEKEARDIRQGRAVSVPPSATSTATRVRLFGPDARLIALARSENGRLKPFCVF